MHPWAIGKRPALDMALALGAAFVLAVLNVAINFIDRIESFFRVYSDYRPTGIIVNSLFVWLAILLWFSFVRWRAAARRRAELEEIVSSISPDTLLVVTPDRRIRMCSTSVAHIFGYTADEIVGRTTDILYEDRRADSARTREIYESLEKDGFHVGMATGKRRDGNTVPLEIITGHLSGGEGAVLLLRDITDRVREDEQRRRLESRMQQQQKTESLGILAGGVAHDFNNLLTVILGNADLVMHDLKGKSELTAHVESIRKAALNAASLCTQLLSYSGQGSYKTEPTDLSGLIRHVERLLEVTLPKGASITYNLADGLPAIEADPPQIQQVLVNLVANAGDALKDQSGSVSGGDVTVATGVLECDGAMADRVFLGESPGKSRCVYLEVSDNGVGMDADTRARMFDPFFTTKFMGRGLGLASVLGIVRAHRGGVDVQSAPGKGTVFRVFFPASAPDGPVT